jgi:site-specific DNA recombinase
MRHDRWDRYVGHQEGEVYLICRDPSDSSKKVFVPEADVLAQVRGVLASIRVPEALLKGLLDHLRASHEAENQFHIKAVASLRRAYDQVRERLGTLLDMRLDQSITKDEHDKKARELKEREAEIDARIQQHRSGDNDFRTTLEGLISVASRASEIFQRSKAGQKRQLLALVFSNLRLEGKKLEFSLRSPFDLMVNRPTYASWLGD